MYVSGWEPIREPIREIYIDIWDILQGTRPIQHRARAPTPHYIHNACMWDIKQALARTMANVGEQKPSPMWGSSLVRHDATQSPVLFNGPPRLYTYTISFGSSLGLTCNHLAPPGLIWSPLDSQSLTLTHLLISNLSKANNNHYKNTHMLHTGTYVTRGNVFLFDTSAVLVIRHDLPYNLLQAVQGQRPYAQTAMHISCWHLQLICNSMRIYIYTYIWR